MVTYADLELDDEAHEVRRAGALVALSPTEFNLLRYLMVNAGKVVSKTQILDRVWNYDFGGDSRIVESYISYLRRKIDRQNPPLIHDPRCRVHVAAAPRCARHGRHMRMLPRPLTLRGRLIAALLVFSAVGLGMFAGASELLLRHSLLSRVDQQLHHFPLRRIAAAEKPNPQRLPSDYRLTVLEPNGAVTYELGQQPGQPGGPALPPLDLVAVRHLGGVPFTVPDRASGSSWRVEAVELPDNAIVAVGLSLGSVDVILRQLLIIEAIVGGIVLFLVGAVATIVVRLGLRPLTRIEHTAEAIAGGDLDRRVPDSDPAPKPAGWAPRSTSCWAGSPTRCTSGSAPRSGYASSCPTHHTSCAPR